ncbi:MAG: universal stress protein [Syntrophotaleaceae bacterium]
MKKLLIALDCSLPSKQAVEYAAAIVPRLPDCSVFLFAVLTGVPCNENAFQELMGPESVELHGDEDHSQEVAQVRQFMDEASRILTVRGFPPERVVVESRPLQRGIAQDILDQATLLGCDTIVVAKRKLSKMKQAVLGSVSRDLIQKAEGMTIWVVDD